MLWDAGNVIRRRWADAQEADILWNVAVFVSAEPAKEFRRSSSPDQGARV
jgi:hypothetical protein